MGQQRAVHRRRAPRAAARVCLIERERIHHCAASGKPPHPAQRALGREPPPAAPWRKDVFLPRGLPGAGSASCFEAPKRIEQGALCGFRAAADGVAARVRPAAGPRSGRGRHGFLRFFLRAASVAASEVVHVTLPPALPRGGRPAARLAHSAGLCARGFRFRGVGRQKRHPSGPGRGHVRAHVLRLRAVCVCKHVGRGRGRAVISSSMGWRVSPSHAEKMSRISASP